MRKGRFEFMLSQNYTPETLYAFADIDFQSIKKRPILN